MTRDVAEGQRFTTHGETLLRRELRKEIVAGAQHFTPGQHRARIVERDSDSGLVAELSYVNGMGRAVLVACARPVGKRSWQAVGYTSAGFYTSSGPQRPRDPEAFLGETSQRELRAAEARFAREVRS